MVATKNIIIISLCAISIGCSNGTSIDKSATNNIPASTHKRLAVSTAPTNIIPTLEVQNIATERAINKGYSVSSRQDLDKVISEQHIQYSNISEKQNIAKIGNILNVDSILIIELTNANTIKMQNGTESINEISMVGRLVNTQSGQVEWIKNVKASSQGLIQSLALLPLQLIAPRNTSLAENAINQIMNEFPPARM